MHVAASAWSPLLDGADARGAMSMAGAIGDRLGDLVSAAPSTASDGVRRAEVALLLAYLGRRRAAESLLEQAARAVAEYPMRPHLFDGLAGVAWITQHVRGACDETEELCGEVDAAMLELLQISPWRGSHDLVSGLVGYGLYALQRLPRTAAVRMVELVVDRLAETAERGAAGLGIAWRTLPELLPPDRRATMPGGHFNLGVAHGLPGVVAFLGGACGAGVAVELARPLLDEAVASLCARRAERPSGALYPSWVLPDGEPRPSRVAWCYGDPGIAGALLSAARAADRPAWAQEALWLARRASHLQPEETSVAEAGLCHGSAGLAHIYNRCHQAGGDPAFAAAARNWLQRTVEAAPDRLEDPSLLTGATGAGLALLAAVQEREPGWDFLLGLSASPPPRL